MKIKKQVVITGIGLDYPSGMAASRQALEMAKGFQSLGIEPILLPFAASSDPESPVKGEIEMVRYRYLFGRTLDISCPLPKTLRRLLQPIFTAFALFGFLKKLEAKRELLVVDTSNRTVPLFIEGIVCRILGIPLVYCMWEEVFTQRVFRQHSVYKKVMMAVESAIEVPILYALGMKLPNEIWCVSQNLVHLMTLWGNGQDKVKFFPVSKYFSSSKMGEGKLSVLDSSDGTTKHIVFTGSINDQRDEFYSLIDAIALVKKQGHNVVWDIYGQDDQRSIQRIKQYARSKLDEKTIVFHGFVSNEVLNLAISRAYAAVALKANISFNRYNFPSRVLGYLDRRCPVLIPSDAHWSSSFKHMENALIVDASDSLDIAKQLLNLLESNVVREHVGNGGFLVLTRLFNMQKNLEAMLDQTNLFEKASGSLEL